MEHFPQPRCRSYYSPWEPGLGLSSVSPWSTAGIAGSTLGIAAILWLIAMQIMSSSMSGYLAGRVSTKWASIHTDEVYFRDTVHRFLAWAVALVITAAFLASAGTYMVGATASSAASAAGSAMVGNSREANLNDYWTDTLLRPNNPVPASNNLRSKGGWTSSGACAAGKGNCQQQTRAI